jgi:predicted nucleotidyltransferase
MNFDVSSRTILLVRHGSHAYGLNTPTSDLDIKGVCIEPEAFHLGFLHKFEQSEEMAAKGHPHDKVVYSLKKFAHLAADCNPNIIEILHVDDSDVMQIDDFGRRLRAERDKFVSRKAMHTFSGYAHAQLKLIRLHYEWNQKGELKMPTREEFGLPPKTLIPKDHLQAATSAIQKKLDQWGNLGVDDFDPATKIRLQETMTEVLAEHVTGDSKDWERAARVLGFSDDFIHVLDMEKAYENKKREFTQWTEWKKNRNEARAALEKLHGYDTKHGMHLLRLMRMAKEILTTGKVIVKRPDRPELMNVRNGGVTFHDLVGEAERLEAECKAAYETSPLPHGPDRVYLNDLVVDMTRQYLKKHG